MKAVEAERNGGDEGDMNLRRARQDKAAKREDDDAEAGQPAIAKQIKQIHIARCGNCANQQQISQVEGIVGGHEKLKQAEQRHVRQAEVMESQRYALGMEEQIGEEQVGLAAEHALEIPGIPKEHIGVDIVLHKPEAAAIEDLDDGGPGHGQQEQRDENQERQMLD